MSRILTAMMVTGALALSACAVATPYQAMQKNGPVSGGYSDLMIAKDRYRISFQGNSSTERDTVERYLLYHAAEVTLRDGYDYFMLTNRHTDTKVDGVVTPDPVYGAWRSDWYFGGRGRFGPRPYSPFWGAGYGGYYGPYFDADEFTQYKANAEIMMGHGTPPADNPAAFDARDVEAHLASTIAKPAPAPKT